MYEIGDLIVYASHGICRIDNICEKNYFDLRKTYYVIQPVDDAKLTINVPIDNNKVVMLKVMDRAEAKSILQSLDQPGAAWIDNSAERIRNYSNIVSTGDRSEISKVLVALMRRKLDVEEKGRKLSVADSNLLASIQKTLFHEIALALDTTYEAILEQVTETVESHYSQSV